MKIIFELDGAGHFILVRHWNNDPNTNQVVDVQKMNVAISKGYRVIRLLQEDVFNNDDAWLDQHLLPLINSSNLVEFLAPNNPQIYDKHREKFNTA